MKRAVTILDAARDPNLFGPWFRKPETWSAWFAFLSALFALPMSEDQVAIFKQCTGREAPPATPATEAWLVCGRRAGKSFILALCAVFFATFKEHRRRLAPGERATVLVVARDRRQARVIFRFIRGLLTNVPMLARMVERETSDAFDLTNSVSIEIHTASFRSIRGYTVVAALCDEIAFWPTDDAADPDVEVLNAVRPAMATIPGAMLLCASSPYARRGALFDAHCRHYGKDGDPVLVWQAPTRAMNATVPQSVIDAAMEADPSSAAAEYLAQFRTDVENFISREVVDAAVIPSRHELPRIGGVAYHGFVDPSGGSSDAMTLAIGHAEANRIILDLVREVRPPFSPEAVTDDFSVLLKAYGCSRVTGDRYGGEWPRERFRTHGVEYATSQLAASDIYATLLPLLNSSRVELLDNPRLIAQLCSLERHTARGGRDSITHPANGHDDLINAAAGAIVAASRVPYEQKVPVIGPIVWTKNAGWSDQPNRAADKAAEAAYIYNQLWGGSRFP